MSNAAASRPRRVSGGVYAAMLGSLTAGLIAAALVIFLLWPQWPGATMAPHAPALPITIEGVTFNVPPAAIRAPVQRRSGVQERIDLGFMWPSLLPPDPAAKPSMADARSAQDRLFISIVSAAGALAPAERLRTIYPRYIEAQPIEEADGLRHFRFRDETPFQGEDLIVHATEPERFMARCTRPGPVGMPGICLMERRIGAAALSIRFPKDWLRGWREVDEAVDHLVASLRPAGG